MKCVTSLFFLIFIQIFTPNASNAAENSVDKDQGAHLYKNINKVNNNFYTAKIPHKKLWLVMERINDRNHSYWLDYMTHQSNPRSVVSAGNGMTTGDGSLHARRVLNEISYKDCEVWVAYITKGGRPEKQGDDPFSYEPKQAFLNGIYKDGIEMFVTVTSTPKALITSHMGVAASVESFRIGRTKGTSIDLHSFAAKVMLMRNPERKYMVNAPVLAMEKIFLSAIPGSVFVGTREKRDFIVKIWEQLPPKKWKNEYRGRITDWVRKRAEEECSKLQGWLDEELGKHPEEKGQLIETYGKSLKLVRMEGEKFVVSDDKIAKEVERYLKVMGDQSSAIPFLDLMKTHPPILSVNEGFQESPHDDFPLQLRKKSKIFDNFSIFDPQNPLEVSLSVQKDNKDYSWMFKEDGPFEPAGDTHFIVVKLDDLANAKLVEPM
jgi:hypothetical protein